MERTCLMRPWHPYSFEIVGDLLHTSITPFLSQVLGSRTACQARGTAGVANSFSCSAFIMGGTNCELAQLPPASASR